MHFPEHHHLKTAEIAISRHTIALTKKDISSVHFFPLSSVPGNQCTVFFLNRQFNSGFLLRKHYPRFVRREPGSHRWWEAIPARPQFFRTRRRREKRFALEMSLTLINIIIKIVSFFRASLSRTRRKARCQKVKNQSSKATRWRTLCGVLAMTDCNRRRGRWLKLGKHRVSLSVLLLKKMQREGDSSKVCFKQAHWESFEFFFVYTQTMKVWQQMTSS